MITTLIRREILDNLMTFRFAAAIINNKVAIQWVLNVLAQVFQVNTAPCSP